MARSWRPKLISALRMIWLRSQERGDAIRSTDRRCVSCGVRESKAKGKEAKITVHHVKRPDWERIVRVIKEELFSDIQWLWPICPDCHDDLHDAEEEGYHDYEFIKLKHEELFNDGADQDQWDSGTDPE